MKKRPGWGASYPGGEAGIPYFPLRGKSRAPAKASAPISYEHAAGMFASRKSTSSVRTPAFSAAASPTMKKRPSWGASCPGGEAGIRTLVTGFTGKTVFETAAFNRSATSPHGGFSGGETGI